MIYGKDGTKIERNTRWIGWDIVLQGLCMRKKKNELLLRYQGQRFRLPLEDWSPNAVWQTPRITDALGKPEGVWYLNRCCRTKAADLAEGAFIPAWGTFPSCYIRSMARRWMRILATRRTRARRWYEGYWAEKGIEWSACVQKKRKMK